MAAPLPVLQEVLRDGDNALIAPAGDVARWRAALERLLADDDLRYRLARTAQADLARSYTWDARARTVMHGLGLELPDLTRCLTVDHRHRTLLPLKSVHLTECRQRRFLRPPSHRRAAR